MKTKKIFNVLNAIALLLGLSVWTACSNSVEDELTIVRDGQPQTMKMNFQGSLIPFDAQNSTRVDADEWSWEDGAIVYIQFYVGTERIRGHAVYSKDSDSWDASYNGQISTADKCEFYFFEGVSTTDKKAATLSNNNAIYADKSATYKVANGVITLEAVLAPITSRIRFTGKNGVSLSVSGITYYTGYNAESNTLTTSSSDIDRTVDSKGSTPYIYGVFTDPAKRELLVTNSVDAVAFRKSFSASVFKIGESGYMTLPTEDTNKGWSIDKSKDPLGVCSDGNHPHQIDMGTGVKFACCNVGAKTPVEYGNYYAWGETTTKTTYNWSTYKWCKGSSSTMTKYCNSSSYGTVDNKTQLELADDAARANWGGTWRMPTIDEFSSLNSNCMWTWTTIRNVVGYKVTATNGNILFFPAAGYRYESSLGHAGSYGYYWSSSLNPSSADYARELYFSSSSHFTSDDYRSRGLSVRPVTE